MTSMRTVFILVALAYLMLSLAACLVARYRFPVRGTVWWAAGNTLSALGAGLISLREIAHVGLSIPLAGTCILGGSFLVLHGMRHFVGQNIFSRRAIHGLFCWLALFAFVLYWFSMVHTDLRLRQIVYALSLALTTGWIAATLLNNTDKKKMICFTGTAYALWSAVFIIWFFLQWFQSPGLRLMDAPPSTVFLCTASTCCMIAIAAGMILMVNEVMEHQLRQKGEELMRENERGKQALLAEQAAATDSLRFADMISHELRTPLSVICLELDVLEMRADNAGSAISPTISSLRQTVETLHNEISERLDEKRLTTAAVHKEYILLDVRLVMDEAIKHVESIRPGVRLDVHFDRPSHPVTARVVRPLLRVAFMSLLEQACEYGEQCRVQMAGSSQGEAIVTFISNNTEDVMEAVHRALRLHNGRVEQEERGRSVTLRFPHFEEQS